MGLQQAYAKSIAVELRHHAVWQPGDPFKLGDYGIISGGVFKKLGNIDEFGITMRRETSSRSFWEFTSAGVTTIALKNEQEIPVAQLLAAPPFGALEAALRINFTKANSLFIRANESFWEQISNLHEVATAAHKHSGWEFHWKIISGLRQADPVIVLMNSRSNSTITLAGKLDLLIGLQSAKISSSSHLVITGDTALKQVGIRGPFLIELVKINRFPNIFGQTKHATGLGSLSALGNLFERVDPTSDLQDDEDEFNQHT